MLLQFLTQKVIAYNTDWTNYVLHTVIASNPRIRVKVIILTLLEFTWTCQQSNINLKLLLWRSTCTRITITDEQSLILTQSRVYFIMSVDIKTLTCMGGGGAKQAREWCSSKYFLNLLGFLRVKTVVISHKKLNSFQGKLEGLIYAGGGGTYNHYRW